MEDTQMANNPNQNDTNQDPNNPNQGGQQGGHGVRKAGATRLAESGATDHMIMVWGGWKTLKEVQRYTRAANRKLLAQQAAGNIIAGTELANLSPRLANQSEKS
jgi:hypothetical protein